MQDSQEMAAITCVLQMEQDPWEKNTQVLQTDIKFSFTPQRWKCKEVILQ